MRGLKSSSYEKSEFTTGFILVQENRVKGGWGVVEVGMERQGQVETSRNWSPGEVE